MTARQRTDADGRPAPMVPETPTRRVQPDGGRATTASNGKVVLAERDAPVVPDLS
ncbi:hypothetical protein ACOZ4N_14305 [Halorientalis pallida]|uniref:hypothetical protein n=1 Tax=Halorientalis TaxID=1073987 RepID=UPI001C31724D|nr:hypothetical protein [Halorientalis regularis]